MKRGKDQKKRDEGWKNGNARMKAGERRNSEHATEKKGMVPVRTKVMAQNKKK